MKIDTDIRIEGMRALMQSLSAVEAERFNPNNPLDPSFPRRRESSKINSPRSGQNEPLAASFEGRPNNGAVPLTWEFIDQLDSGLRRNDRI